MEACERYYRRSYNAINNLINAYKKGYNKENTLNFRNYLTTKYKSNPLVIQSEINNIMFTIMIALLGLNKEDVTQNSKYNPKEVSPKSIGGRYYSIIESHSQLFWYCYACAVTNAYTRCRRSAV
jgi:hypothetical protein